MSPRYPVATRTNETERLRELERERAREREQSLALDRELDERYIQARVAYERSLCSEESPYTARCSHSWFADKLLEHDSRKRAEAAFQNPILRGRDPGVLGDPGVDDRLSEARQRLATVPILDDAWVWQELRDLTTASGSGGAFVPGGGPPLYLAEQFAVAARGRAALADALPKRPLVRVGATLEVPRLATGSSAAVQATENVAVSETDPTTALASANKATVAGMVDMSRQLFELGQPGLDSVIARDLGAAVAERIEAQLIAGTNASGQTEGLATVSGGVTVAYTDASPTPDEFVSKLWQAYREIAEAGGGPAEPSPNNYLVVMAPRRLAWLAADAGNAGGELPPLPGRPLASTGIRLTLGAGTNEDEAYVIALPEVFVSIGDTTIGVFEEVGSGTQTVRVRAHAFLATMFSRQPKAVARISGTGLVGPTL